MKSTKMMMALGLAIAGTGCLTDEELDESAELSETTQALSGITYHHLTAEKFDELVRPEDMTSPT